MNNNQYNKITILFIYLSLIYLIAVPVILDATSPKITTEKTISVEVQKDSAKMTITRIEYAIEEKKEEAELNLEETTKETTTELSPENDNASDFQSDQPTAVENQEQIIQQHEEIKGDNFSDILIPPTTGFKSYMSYAAITKKSSPQYALQQLCVTDSLGLRRYNDRYVIAVGTGVGGQVGTCVDLILENGTVIPCVIGEYKATQHTDATNLISGNGCVSEFLIDNNSLYGPAKRAGDISACFPEWASRVVIIRRYN